VYAYAHEIDAWLTGQSLPLNGAAPVEGTSPTRRGWLIPAAVLAVFFTAVTWWVARASAPGPVENVKLTGNKILAYDAEGRAAWSFELPGAVSTAIPDVEARRKQIVDMDGDGIREVLVAAHFANSTGDEDPRSILYCFREDGSLVWQHEPVRALTFGGRRFQGPWIIEDVVVSQNSGPRTVFVAYRHNTWWPSFIEKLDATGRDFLMFVNPGWVMRIAYLRAPHGGLLLAGGVHNAQKMGFLAAIGESQGPTTAPLEEQLEFRCDDCSAGAPFRYFLLPPSELRKALDGRGDWVWFFGIHGASVLVRTSGTLGADAFYDFNLKLEPSGVSRPDHYWDFHRKLEQEGKVSHPANDCPERKALPPPLVWTSAQGWRPAPLNSK